MELEKKSIEGPRKFARTDRHKDLDFGCFTNLKMGRRCVLLISNDALWEGEESNMLPFTFP